MSGRIRRFEYEHHQILEQTRLDAVTWLTRHGIDPNDVVYADPGWFEIYDHKRQIRYLGACGAPGALHVVTNCPNLDAAARQRALLQGGRDQPCYTAKTVQLEAPALPVPATVAQLEAYSRYALDEMTSTEMEVSP